RCRERLNHELLSTIVDTWSRSSPLRTSTSGFGNSRIVRVGYGSWQGSTGSHTATPVTLKTVGRGVLELRLTYGPGYRVYYTQRGNQIVLLLCGGDKSTQQKDIT